MNKITLTLVIAKPGHLRKGLQSILRTVPHIEILAESPDPSVLLKIDGEVCPELILVDAAIMGEANWSALRKSKAVFPGVKVIVLTENDQQGQDAKEAGADYYLLKGFPASELARLVETSLIPESRDENNLSIKSE